MLLIISITQLITGQSIWPIVLLEETIKVSLNACHVQSYTSIFITILVSYITISATMLHVLNHYIYLIPHES